MAKHASFKITISAEDKASGTLKALKGAVTGVIGAWVGWQTARGIGDFFKQSVVRAGESELALKKVEAALKSTGNQVGMTLGEFQKMATQMQATTAIGDETVMQAQALGLTFTSIGRDVFPDFIKATADMSQALGYDMRQSVIQLGKALQDPTYGITALRRVGINTEELQAKIKDGMPLMEKQRLILQEINTEFGGMAEAIGDTMQGRLARIQNLFGEMQEQLGGVIINTDAWKESLDKIEAKIDEFSVWLEENKDVVEDFADSALTAFQGILDGLTWLLKGTMNFMAAWKEAWGAELQIQNEYSETWLENQQIFLNRAIKDRNEAKKKFEEGLISKEAWEKEQEIFKRRLEASKRMNAQFQEETNTLKTIVIPTLNKYQSTHEASNKNLEEELKLREEIRAKMAEEFGERMGYFEIVKESAAEEENAAIQRFKMQQEIAQGMLEVGASIEAVATATGLSVEYVRSLTETVGEAKDTWPQFTNMMSDFGYSFTENVIDNITSAHKAWDDFVTDFLKSMALMIVKKALLAPFGGGFFMGTGGIVRRFQTGGYVEGGPPYTDRIPAMLMPKEGVLNHLGMRMVGGEAGLNALNRGQTYNNDFNVNITVNGGGDAGAISAAIENRIRTVLPAMIRDAERRRQN